MEFIFNIYDVHQQGAVNRDELAALLNHVPKSIMRVGRAASVDSTNHHQQHQRGDGQQRRSTAPVRHSPPSSTGTASAVSRGDGFDRCSPDRSSSGTGTSVGATAIGGGVGSAGDGADGVVVAGELSRDPSDDDVAAKTAPEASAEIEGKDNAPLTSGNLMQLHLASLSQSQSGEESTASPEGAVEGATAAAGTSSPPPVPRSSSAEEAESGGGGSGGEASGDSGRSSPVGPSTSPPTGPLATCSPSAGGEAAPPSCSTVVEAAVVGTTANGSGGGGGSDVYGYEGGVDSCGDGGACAEAHGAGGLPMTSNASTGGDTEVIHTVSGGGGGGAVSPSGDEVGTAGGATMSEGGVGDNRTSSKGADRGRRRGSRSNSALFVPGGKGSSGGAGRGAVGRSSNTLHSDASTDDGTSTAAPEHPYHAHWEEFTNNDIVDQVGRVVEILPCVWPVDRDVSRVLL